LRSELFRLTAGVARELGTGDSVREAEEVLDRIRVRRLSAGDVAIGDHRLQAVGSGIDRRGEAGGRGAGGDEVAVGQLRRPPPPPRARDPLDRRFRDDELTVDEHRQRRIVHGALIEELVGLRATRFVPLVRLRGAREEIAESIVLRIQAPPHDLHRWTYRAHPLDSSAEMPAYASSPPSACTVRARNAIPDASVTPTRMSTRPTTFTTVTASPRNTAP